jgi:hypothetical protein
MNLAEFRDPDFQRESENESAPLNIMNRRINQTNDYYENENKVKINKCLIILFITVFFIFVFSIYQLIQSLNEFEVPSQISNLKKNLKNKKGNKQNISSDNAILNSSKLNKSNYNENKYIIKEPIININIKKDNSNDTYNKSSININNTIRNEDIIKTNRNISNIINSTNSIEEYDKNKISVAFIYHILHSNGVARVITLTADHLVKTGKYNVFFITGKPYERDFKYDNRIKRFVGHDNITIIRNLTRKYNIKYFILNNQLTESLIRALQALNGKVIGIFHGVYESAIFHNVTLTYRSWYKFDVYNSFIVIAPDDLYIYKKLGLKNGTFIPNLYTFDPDKAPASNLTKHNIAILGRVGDKIKGIVYALKTMSYIVKYVPDSNLILATSDTNTKGILNYAKNLNISKHIIIKYFPNITEIFLNSSVLMFTSLSEAFPMAMNEGKAHGLPVVAFDVPFSIPYQSGVITVPQLNCEALARETVKLLKDYNYRKKKGEEAKLSLYQFNNNNTIHMWERLFDTLDKGMEEYRKFQKEIEDKYYHEQAAKQHVSIHYKFAHMYNKHFRCHTFENMLNLTYIKNIKECQNVTRRI